MTAGAQRLQIVDAVSSQWKGHDVVHQHGSSQPSALGTVPAQRLRRQHGVADALPALVVAALVGGQAIVGKTVAPALSAVGAAAVAHNAGAGPVRTSSVHGIASERSDGAEFGATCHLAAWQQGKALSAASARPGRLVASHQRKRLRCSRPFNLYPLPPFFTA